MNDKQRRNLEAMERSFLHDIELLQRGVDLVIEHFEFVQIFTTRHEAATANGTLGLDCGLGNSYARKQFARDWVNQNPSLINKLAFNDKLQVLMESLTEHFDSILVFGAVSTEGDYSYFLHSIGSPLAAKGYINEWLQIGSSAIIREEPSEDDE